MPLARPSWQQFATDFRKRWKQGEHIFINSRTGGGKTELGLELSHLPGWSSPHVAFLNTKPRDPIMRSVRTADMHRVREWRPDGVHSRVMLTPQILKDDAQTQANQHAQFRKFFSDIYHDGGWLAVIDEVAYMSADLKLADSIKRMHHMGRALGLTMLSATQRPKNIPVIVPQSATYAFLGKMNGRDEDIKAVAELGGNTRELRQAVDSLEGNFDFVFVDTLGRMPLQIVNTRAK